MKILALSDKVVDRFYTPHIKERFGEIDLVISCGDLSFYYLEFILTVLNVPLFYVRGNHDKKIVYGEAGPRIAPLGGIDLHKKVIFANGLLMAGVEGSLRYRKGPFQYTQGEMWRHAFHLVPALLANRILRGRSLDILITHAPPLGIHDKDDLPHRGVSAFHWLLRVFKPRFHLHGHIHLIGPNELRMSKYESTQVINAYGYREFNIDKIIIPLKNQD